MLLESLYVKMIYINDNNYYAICLLAALVFSIEYVFIRSKNKISLLFFILSLPVILFFGKIFTYLFFNTKHLHLYQLGLSSIGCLIGYLLSIMLFKIIIKNFNKEINMSSFYFIIPFAYSIGKVGCFFHGCCRGFIYNGFFSVHYNNYDNYYFPIQFVESLLFMLLFIVLNNNKEKRYMNQITVISFCLLKFILDFFRYNHSSLLSINQIFSLIIVLIEIIIIKYKLKNN